MSRGRTAHSTRMRLVPRRAFAALPALFLPTVQVRACEDHQIRASWCAILALIGLGPVICWVEVRPQADATLPACGGADVCRSVDASRHTGPSFLLCRTLRRNGHDCTPGYYRAQIVGLRRSRENRIGFFLPWLLRLVTFDQHLIATCSRNLQIVGRQARLRFAKSLGLPDVSILTKVVGAPPYSARLHCRPWSPVPAD
jgi:hypothetical protein